MSEIRIERYQETAAEWNTFVADSANGTFLFNRGYMDYHADRFSDFSLAARKGGRLVALLPANAADNVLNSHSGLTYGGWILPRRHVNGVLMKQLWERWLDFCRAEGFKGIDYKPIPHIYHLQPCEEDRYLLFGSGARLTACGLSSTIDLRLPRAFNDMQKRHLREALASGAAVAETEDFSEFWQILEANLQARHGVRPVHTLDEIQMLHGRFPENIRLFTVRTDDALAGVVMYLSDITAHAQYIAANPRARELNLLPLLFHTLINKCRDYRYFDFGISTEDGGSILNEGLLTQKNSLGGSGTVYERFFIEL